MREDVPFGLYLYVGIAPQVTVLVMDLHTWNKYKIIKFWGIALMREDVPFGLYLYVGIAPQVTVLVMDLHTWNKYIHITRKCMSWCFIGCNVQVGNIYIFL